MPGLKQTGEKTKLLERAGEQNLPTQNVSDRLIVLKLVIF